MARSFVLTLLALAPACRATDASSSTGVPCSPPAQTAPQASEPDEGALGATAPEGSLDALDRTLWRVGEAEGGRLTVAWRAPAGTVPRNERVDLEVLLFLDAEPLPGAALGVRGWMPDHGHGFVQLPWIGEEGDGRYRVRDLLLHMRGTWQLFFQVAREGESDVVRFDLEL